MYKINQKVGRLLKAFATLIKFYSDITLILKGRDTIFSSKNFIAKTGKVALNDTKMEIIKSRIICFGQNLSFR